MQEFSSVSASAYEPDSLTTQLNEKAGDGWEVVSIVSAGTNVVAYLSREATQIETVEEVGGAGEEAGEPAVVAGAIGEEQAAESPVTPEPAETPEPEPVEEPAGWAAAPEEQVVDPTPTAADALATGAAAGGVAAATDMGATEPAVEEPAVEEPAVEEPAVEEPAVEEPAAEPAAGEPAPASEPSPAVPAGWYSDPSGRFELRYWDGTAWTEHVSRAGQQYTDPPVA